MSPFTVIFSHALVATPAVPDGDESACMPPLDVVESSWRLVITVDLPGARPDGLRVSCVGDVLVIDGTRAATPGCRSSRSAIERFHVVERPAGPFRRV